MPKIRTASVSWCLAAAFTSLLLVTLRSVRSSCVHDLPERIGALTNAAILSQETRIVSQAQPLTNCQPLPAVLEIDTNEQLPEELDVVQQRRASLLLQAQKDKLAYLNTQTAPDCGKRYLSSFDDCLDSIPQSERAEFIYTRDEECQKYAKRSPRGDLLDASYAFQDPDCEWIQGDGVSKACMYYCYYSEKYGFAKISMDLWKAAQKGEKALWASSGVDDDRGAENKEGFDDYRALKGLKLGRLLEVGSGPFTQTKTILEALRAQGEDPSISEIHVADPGVDDYLKNVEHCSYRSGRLSGYPVKTHTRGGEDLEFHEEFDTVVSINVIEHCRDAFEYIERMHRALKPGGVLVFHDRVYDIFLQILHPERHGPYEVGGLHPLRIKKRLIDVLIKPYRYEIIFYSEKMTKLMRQRATQQIPEEPIWLIARKLTA